MTNYTFTTDDAALAERIAELIKGHTSSALDPWNRVKSAVIKAFKECPFGYSPKIQAVKKFRELSEHTPSLFKANGWELTTRNDGSRGCGLMASKHGSESILREAGLEC